MKEIPLNWTRELDNGWRKSDIGGGGEWTLAHRGDGGNLTFCLAVCLQICPTSITVSSYPKTQKSEDILRTSRRKVDRNCICNNERNNMEEKLSLWSCLIFIIAWIVVSCYCSLVRATHSFLLLFLLFNLSSQTDQRMDIQTKPLMELRVRN